MKDRQNGIRHAERELATAELRQLTYAVATQTEHVGKLAAQVVNQTLLTQYVVFPVTGPVTFQFEVPTGAVAVANHGANPVVMEARSPTGDAAPQQGVGMTKVRAGTAATIAVSSRTITLWGTAGDAATFQAFTKPQPPAWGPA